MENLSLKKKISLWINKHIVVYSKTLIPHEVLPRPSGHSGDTDISVFIILPLAATRTQQSKPIASTLTWELSYQTCFLRKMFLRLSHSPLDIIKLLYHENNNHNLAEIKPQYQWNKNHFK